MSNAGFAFQHSFAEALEGLYVDHAPEGFPSPELLEFNRPLLKALGLPSLSDGAAGQIFSGTSLPEGARPVAQAYAGHQFGQLSPQLGDGRALLLGEFLDGSGARFDLQLKGSGRTPFSRGGDGRATLGPILRELLVSEAMARLGVSTSRVLAVVKTGEEVRRDWLLPGAVLARVASSHLRIGSLEFLAVRGQHDKLRDLVRYAIERHYPHQAEAENLALALLSEVARAQARLIASWMHVGFIHGVMNTDNVTLSGETIDYGPCAFLEVYAPETTFSSIDRNGRYAFGNQPSIGVWNMLRMAEALLPLLADEEATAKEAAEGAIDSFRQAFNEAYLSGLRKKIGLEDAASESVRAEDAEAPDEDVELMSELLEWMHATQQDFTMTFRRLARDLRRPAGSDPSAHQDDETFAAWSARWIARLGDVSHAEVADRMDAQNPIYIPRNHLVEDVLAKAHEGNMAPFREFMDVLADPYEERPGLEHYAAAAPQDFGPYRTFCGT